MINSLTPTLQKKEQLAKHIWKFTFQLPKGQELHFKAGQYMVLKIGEARRLYSICSPDHIKDSFELLVEILSTGLGSQYLINLKIGETAHFDGPAGMFYIRSDHRNKIFLATGTGIAPIKSKIETFLYKSDPKKDIRLLLFWGLKSAKDVYFLEELKKLSQKHPHFTFHICLSRENELPKDDNNIFQKGRVNAGVLACFNSRVLDHLSAYIGKKTDTSLHDFKNDFEYYVCGGREVVASLVAFLKECGIRKDNIFFEKF